MNKRMKYMALAAVACFAVSTASATVVFTDTFNYTNGNAMVVEGGWTTWGGSGGSDAGTGVFWGNSVAAPGAWLEYNDTSSLSEDELITMDANVTRTGGYGYTMTISLWDGSDTNTIALVAGGVEEAAAAAALTQVSYTVGAADVGKQVIFKYEHSSNWGETADVTFQINDTTTPAPPEWHESPIEESGIVGRDFTGTLAGKATDPNFDDITYSRDSSGPAWLDVAADGTLTGIPVSSGTNVFTVLASDENTTPSTNTLNIVVSEALPPDWLEDPMQGVDGFIDNAYGGTLAGLAVDPNGDPVTYNLVSTPTWLSIAPDGALSGSPELAHAGSNTFTVAATDGLDGTNNATLNIFVSEVPNPPAIILVDNATANGSFEEPDSGKVFFNVGAVPFWSSWTEQQTADNDTGTDTGSVGTHNGLDGARVAFLQPGGAIVNMATNAPHTIAAGDVIAYSFWNSLEGRASATISLVYDDAGTLTQIPGTDIVAADGTQGIGEFTVQAGDAWIGKTLGVGIVSGGSWPEVDQVMLGVTRKPADAVSDLVITGPITGGTQMVLSWTSESGGSYGVQTNSNLIIANWQTLVSGLSGTGGTLSVTNDIGPDQTFYQVITE